LSEYFLTIITFGLTFGSLAVAGNLSVGFVSLLSISHAAFFSAGAHTYGVLGTSMGGNYFVVACAIGFAIAIACVIAATLGLLLIVPLEQ
jgi:ABC-type branched-subunit amino acid transport system permease subunit